MAAHQAVSLLTALLKKKKLALRYTLLWLSFGFVLLLMVIFPVILTILRKALGIASEMNALFVLLIGGLVILVLYLTSLASVQQEKLKQLLQKEALLEQRIRELEAAAEEREKE